MARGHISYFFTISFFCLWYSSLYVGTSSQLQKSILLMNRTSVDIKMSTVFPWVMSQALTTMLRSDSRKKLCKKWLIFSPAISYQKSPGTGKSILKIKFVQWRLPYEHIEHDYTIILKAPFRCKKVLISNFMKPEPIHPWPRAPTALPVPAP